MLNFKPPFKFQVSPRFFLGKSALLLLAVMGAVRALAVDVTLAWDPSPSADVTSYKVHYGTSPATYSKSLLVGNTTTATIPGLTAGLRYYFAVTAVSSAGLESPYSAEISHVPSESRPAQTFVDLRMNAQKQAVVTVTGVAGQSWTVQASTNLVQWVDLGSVTNGLTGTTQFTDPAPKLEPRRFYRLKVP